MARVFYVPIILCIEADHREIAAREGVHIAEAVVAEERHLRKDVLVPSPTDPLPPDDLTLPTRRFLHCGIQP